ncbi:MAG: hypothetical protein ACO1SV_00770 [Fimbriimonas sp.]
MNLDEEGWHDTGVDLPAGVFVQATATGSGVWNGLVPAYPNGSPGWPFFPIEGLALGHARTPFSLLCAVTDVPPGLEQLGTVQGGASFSFASPGGRLYLGFNDLDGAYHDNDGAFSVTFQVALAPRDEEEDAEMTTRYIDDVATFWTQLTDGGGTAADATGTPGYRVYEETTDTPILVGDLAKQDDAGTTGYYRGQVVASAANGFEIGKSYCVRITATVAGVTQAKVVDRFVIRPTVAASVWDASLGSDAPGGPATMGGALRRVLSKLRNRMTKAGNLVTLYAADNTTVLASQGYSVTDAGFDRSPDA